jgi:16S rRNA C967 or C1407 C5-methylase (RsmB/RsmF family)
VNDTHPFFAHYAAAYGERWPALLDALRGAPVYHALHFTPEQAPYFLDEASLAGVSQLDVQPGMQVLDMCAAPGGKSLVLASRLAGEGLLQSNDRSADRRIRLRRVLDASLPESWRKIVQISGHDATRWGVHEKDRWDRILLDAPCSSERHVLESPKHLAEWSFSRIKRLAEQQGAMLAAAVDALRPGGEMVYSTCALASEENDRVVEKILKKRKGKVELMEPLETLPGADVTACGRHILPDQTGGRGPIYFARLRRI